MFFTDAILSRRGPLARVWLAAHMERKLSKTQTLQTDIEESVGAIMGQEVEVMALRLSGQLLLGVVRIYSRKAKYLLDDCNEALLKIKMAFRPGMVDMTEDQLVVNKNAITLQSTGMDFDFMIPDIDWNLDLAVAEKPVARRGQHLARQADITLANTMDLDLVASSDFDLGPSDGIGSQDFDGDFDLGITWEDEPVDNDGQSVHDNDDSMSIEAGLDAPAPRHSIDPNIFGRGAMDQDIISTHNRSRAGSQALFDDDAMDFGADVGTGVDLTELGIGFDDNLLEPIPEIELPTAEEEREKTPGQTRASSRFSSPLTEVPQTPPPEAPFEMSIDAPQVVAPKQKRKPKEQKQIIDTVTELADGPGANISRGRKSTAGLGAPMAKDVSNILAEPRFLHRSSVVSRLREIRDDPIAHFLPTKTTPTGTFLCVAPPGLPPQLSGMFMQPTAGPSKRRGGSPDKAPIKKRRVDDEEEIEQARREASRAPSTALGSDIFGGAGSIVPVSGLDYGPDNTLGVDEFQMDVGPEEPVLGDVTLEERARSMSRYSTPGRYGEVEAEDSYADAACPIVEFDFRTTQSQSIAQDSSSTDKEAPAGEHDSKGYSKNTVKAMSIIRKELRPRPDDVEGEEKVLSFNRMADKATRRAASSFFFELLVLSTRDCIKVSQSAPFENIEIRAKDKLWEHQEYPPASRLGSLAPSSRHPSVAPPCHTSVAPSNMRASVARSIGSAMGL